MVFKNIIQLFTGYIHYIIKILVILYFSVEISEHRRVLKTSPPGDCPCTTLLGGLGSRHGNPRAQMTRGLRALQLTSDLSHRSRVVVGHRPEWGQVTGGAGSTCLVEWSG